MKQVKLLLILPLLFLLCGCSSQNYENLTELENSIINDLIKDNIVINYDCPNIYIKPEYWAGFYVYQKETVGKTFVKKCQKSIFIKDTYNNKKLAKCTLKACKIYD